MKGAGDSGSRDYQDLPDHRREMAYQRTIMAVERTLMAWVRTALSMIGFGFTIARFFQYLHREQGINRWHPSWLMGLAFTGLGTLLLVFAMLEQIRFAKKIKTLYGRSERSLAFAAAITIALIGAFAFVDILISD